MKHRSIFLSLSLIFATSISTYFVTTSTRAQMGAAPAQTVADNEYQVGAILFQQRAAEYRALVYQSFNFARMMLDSDFEKKNLKLLPKSERRKPRAVIVDVDETVLDNSPHQAELIKLRLPFTNSLWTDWCNKRAAKAIPGAVDFLSYAAQKGARVFYVTNRNESEKQATIDNLKSVGFPDVSNETVVVRGTESSKELRRQKISEKYRIVLLAGDNLNDLAQVFERKSIDERFAEVEKARQEFGKRFIVLPNAMYGDWEAALYEYKRLSESEKTARRNSLLIIN